MHRVEKPWGYELIFADNGEKLEIDWRDPHDAPLDPAQEYERKVVAARRRRLIYPYEIVKMLLGAAETAVFEEYDLDATAAQPTAVSVADRKPPPLRPVSAGKAS